MHTSTPPRCPNPKCGASITDYSSFGAYTRLSSIGGTQVVAVTCRRCKTLLGIVPANLDSVRTKVERLR